MRNFSRKYYRENRKKHFMFNCHFSRTSYCLCGNVGKYGTAGQVTDCNIIRRMRIACWVTEAIDLHTEYVVQWNLGSRMPLITNKSVHEQIFRKKKSRVTNGVSSNEQASRQQRLATSWEYRRESVSYCVTFAQCTKFRFTNVSGDERPPGTN
jgi:transposase InsO family protein